MYRLIRCILRDDKKLAPAKPERALFLGHGLLDSEFFARASAPSAFWLLTKKVPRFAGIETAILRKVRSRCQRIARIGTGIGDGAVEATSLLAGLAVALGR